MPNARGCWYGTLPRCPILCIGGSEGRSLPVTEARHLLDAASGDRLEALYAITVTFGLRRGEALGLSLSDIDLDTGWNMYGDRRDWQPNGARRREGSHCSSSGA